MAWRSVEAGLIVGPVGVGLPHRSGGGFGGGFGGFGDFGGVVFEAFFGID